MRVLIAVAVLTLSAASVQAQEQQDRSLRMATYVFAATAAADWTTTGIALSRGAMHEANPFLQWAHDDTAKTVIAGAAMDAVSIYAVRRWIGPTHPRAVAVVFFAQSALRLYFVQKAAKQTAAVRR